ncbi:MAG: ornithine carbamoyltransferase [Sumerlaeia bacterium]
MTKHFLGIGELNREIAEDILARAEFLKSELKSSLANKERQTAHLNGQTIAMIFEKPSLRTRCSFEVGIYQLGGHAVNLPAADIGRLGERESICDFARNLSQWCQLIEARVFSHESVVELAHFSTIPVINGLSDFEHPTQTFADYLTIKEKLGRITDFHLAWIGDCFNVSNSLMIMACIFGNRMTIACPDGYDPSDKIWEVCEKFSPQARELIRVVRDPHEAVKSADVLYTDTWVSMGFEDQSVQRFQDFQGYQINKALLEHAPQHAFVMHDMPAYRGKEITGEVLDGPRCEAYTQAENRLHAIKAIMTWCAEAPLK